MGNGRRQEWGATAVRGVEGTCTAIGVSYLTASLVSWRQAEAAWEWMLQMVLNQEVLQAAALCVRPSSGERLENLAQEGDAQLTSKWPRTKMSEC